MTEKLKRMISLLCLIAMLCVVSVPAQAGGEHPWDSENDTGQSNGTVIAENGVPDGSSEQGLAGVIVIGSGGFISFIGQSFYSFIVRITGQDFTKNGKQSTGTNGNSTQS